MTLSDLASRAAAELRDAVAAIDPAAMEGMVSDLARARRIACYGVGREGLMMRALAMRLYHMGLDAHVVGDMSCPPVGPGDVLVVSAGPGGFSTVGGLIGVARAAGARIACVTAVADGSAPQAADRVFIIWRGRIALMVPLRLRQQDTTVLLEERLPADTFQHGLRF